MGVQERPFLFNFIPQVALQPGPVTDEREHDKAQGSWAMLQCRNHLPGEREFHPTFQDTPPDTAPPTTGVVNEKSAFVGHTSKLPGVPPDTIPEVTCNAMATSIPTICSTY